MLLGNLITKLRVRQTDSHYQDFKEFIFISLEATAHLLLKGE